VIKGLTFFWGKKLAKTCSFVGRHIIVQQEKISRAERSWMNPLNALQEAIRYSFTIFCIYCFSLWYELFVHYALKIEKIYQHGPDEGPLEFQFQLGEHKTQKSGSDKSGERRRGVGVIKGCNIFLGQKLANLQLCGQAHYHATRKNLGSKMQLDKPIERASGGDPLLPYKILHLLFFPLV
jgi:hypothetical protein